MSAGVRLFTVQDLETFPEDGNRYEVIEGELYVSHAPHAEHQVILDEATTALKIWHRASGLGLVVSGAGLIFSRHDGVIPDLMWFSDERLPQAMINPATGEWDGRFYAAPDLAIEVLSPGAANEARDREVKLTLYSRRGVREYWIIDRFTRTVAVYRRTDRATLELAATLTDPDTLSSPLLPGFALVVRQLFHLPEALRR
jgi:Uma2 family endonuclease